MPGARDVLDLFNLHILKYQACDMMFFTSLMPCDQCVQIGPGSRLRGTGNRARKGPTNSGEGRCSPASKA
jgi:hypothetical protein